MITFYTCPKPWLQEYIHIQNASIKSLLECSASPQHVVLLGDDFGTADAAKRLGVSHRGGLKLNEWNTPLVSSIMQIIREECQTELACFINTDIVIGDDFIKTVLSVLCEADKYSNNRWLMIGQRTDLANTLPTDDLNQIRTNACARGRQHGVDGIDYFVFPSRTFEFVYPFALGKFSWDQWLVGNVYRQGFMCVDATKTVLAVHLNAEWFFQGKPEKDWKKVYQSEEAVINRSFDYYQKTIASGTTHYTRFGKDNVLLVVAHTNIGASDYL